MHNSMLVTVAEAAEILGLHAGTVRQMCYRDILKRIYPTGRRSVRLRRDDVLALARPNE